MPPLPSLSSSIPRALAPRAVRVAPRAAVRSAAVLGLLVVGVGGCATQKGPRSYAGTAGERRLELTGRHRGAPCRAVLEDRSGGPHERVYFVALLEPAGSEDWLWTALPPEAALSRGGEVSMSELVARLRAEE